MPQSQPISAPAAICPVYCIQLPPASRLMQDLDQPPLFFLLHFPAISWSQISTLGKIEVTFQEMLACFGLADVL